LYQTERGPFERYIMLLHLLLPICILASMVREEGANLVVDNGRFVAVVSKSSGMLESVRLSGSSFELAADYGDHSLFFPEVAFLEPDPSSWDAWSNPKGKYFGGRVRTEVLVNRDDVAIIGAKWENGYQDVAWEYRFVRGEPYISVYTERTVKDERVYVNFQQCVMFTADMDDSYIVDYTGNFVPTMLDGWGTAPGSTVRQHSMFSAMDAGTAVRYPALVWHDDETGTVAGVLVTYVTPNQRESISYHGGGRSRVRHPGYAEGQFNWFGKSDNESLYLRKGTKFGMEMYYYFAHGDLEDFDAFNRGLFNPRHYDIRRSEDYWAASWGGRRTSEARYSWSYPQATSNYISSQELFRPRAISIPRSQNGTLDPEVFDLRVVAGIGGREVDLTPLPTRDGEPLLHKEAATEVGDGYMVGEVTWDVEGLENVLRYKVFEGSDKLIVSGRVSALRWVRPEEIYVELGFSPRVREVARIGKSVWDIRCDDEVYRTLGIALYNITGADTVAETKDALRLYLVHGMKDFVPPGTSWNYEFWLFPHLGYDLESPSQITPLRTEPERRYREYYKTLPGLEERKEFGIRPDPNVFAYSSLLGPDFLEVNLYMAPGRYPLRLFLEGRKVFKVLLDGTELPGGSWRFDPGTGVLEVDADWKGISSLKVTFGGEDVEEGSRSLPWSPYLIAFPNPFNRFTAIKFFLPFHTDVRLAVYGPTGAEVRNMVCGRMAPGDHLVLWDGRDERGRQVGSGVYIVTFDYGYGKCTRKVALVR